LKKISKKFRFSIDRGGTFTDVYAQVPGKPGYAIVKLLSTDPGNYDDAPREGIRRILLQYAPEAVSGELIDPSCIEWIRMGTTVATNALLERKGARCALLVSRGFADILQIGDQSRPHLFDLKIRKPALLYEQVLEVDERVRLFRAGEDPAGEMFTGVTGEQFLVLAKPDMGLVKEQLGELLAAGITSLAVVFMHAYACPRHEEQIGRLAVELGFSQVSLSSQVMPMVKLVPRGDTTLVDSYLTPHIQSYIKSFKRGFKEELKNTRLQFMQSDGGLTTAIDFNGSRSLLSGPAGGVVGYAMTTSSYLANTPVIGFDMGGTSTDVSRFSGNYDLCYESRTAGVRIQAPQLDIRTVAAGGGSRLFFENGMFQVGPESAGADPGPVCYRKNGFLALTDANLVLGRLQPQHFPAIFGSDENQPLDRDGARLAMQQLTDDVNCFYAQQGIPQLSVEEVALGFVQVANEQMVRPIKEVSIMRGVDVKEHVLATFGGAGGQHACAIARSLGMKKIFVHRFAGILSAYGLGLADTVAARQQAASCRYDQKELAAIQQKLIFLQEETEQELRSQGIPASAIKSVSSLNLRYQGTDSALMIDMPEDGDFGGAFKKLYLREFGFSLPGRDIFVDDLRVRSVARETTLEQYVPEVSRQPAVPAGLVSCYFASGWMETELFQFRDVAVGQTICGPAVVLQDTSTVVIEPDCRALVTAAGDLEICIDYKQTAELASQINPIQLAIFSNLFMSIAEQMGRMLQKTAISTNIKERLDFSCALFDSSGNLVANAPHVPVHLGAMSQAVREQICRNPDIKPGTVLLSNHPAAGGSHLPDMTVITPVFQGKEVIFYVASRGHHADIGGLTPGSMPPDSRKLTDEGVAIMSFTLVKDGEFREGRAAELLQESRSLNDVLSDLKAQVAANQKGIELIKEMVATYSLEVVHSYMEHVQTAAEQAVRESLIRMAREKNWKGKTIKAIDALDDGSQLVLQLTIDGDSGNTVFDFAGTGLELWGNLNAPVAVTSSAILYSLRCLLDKDIPLNHGCLIPVEIRLPPGCLLNPSPDAAVVGGNVLTSQRLVDVILKAFGVAAASQGCMNNLTFGNEGFGYYETIGGGAGAGHDWHGQSGVHTHMTNTRITDPEILERRYPVLLHTFSLRRNSGGQGRYAGGDGLIREIEFLEPMDVAILSERRVFAPYGLEGGKPGKRGENLYIRQDGTFLNLGGKNQFKAAAGERIRIETPGGGGFGVPVKRALKS
jgi:5-oxoprolinase (ATP-hydrolysing)